MFREPFAVIACALFASACSSAPAASSDSFDGAPIAVMTSDEGGVHVEVKASPDPPTRGVDAFQLAITDRSGAPMSGLSIAVVPWMPAHGHGASVTPTITDRGGGTYVVDDVDLYMPGHWELRTEIRGGSLASAQHVTPAVDVQ